MKKLLCILILLLALVCAFTACNAETPRSITKSEIVNGELVLTFSDGTTENLGKVVGDNGAKGDKGDTGAQGPQGAAGATGATGTTGATGATIAKVEFDDQSRLVITLTDGTTLTPVELPEKEEHVHTFGDWLPFGGITNVFCEERAFYRVCAECGNIEWRHGLGKDHEFVTITYSPTCTKKGYDEKTCQICGKVVTENETPLVPHMWKDTYTSDSSFHWLECSDCSATNTPAVHDVGTDGFCTVCDHPVNPTEGVVYALSADGTYAIVSDYTGEAKRVIIADTYLNVSVKEIGETAFSGAAITTIVIPDSVTNIGRMAFNMCTSLTSITIPKSVISIDDFVFHNCRSLASITVEEGNTVYHSEGNCLIETASKTLVRGCATSIIPTDGSVTSIGKCAFFGCTSLTSITIPSCISDIGISVFHLCTSLTSIIVEEGNAVYHSAGNCLIETASKTLVAGCKNSIIPTDGSVTSIGDYAFSGCTELTSINIPNSVTSIGKEAFNNCRALTSITIPKSVSSICSKAFYACDSLESITVEEENTVYHSVGNCLIETASKTLVLGCKNSVLPTDGSVTSIGDYALSCLNFTSISIPESVISIGEWAFAYASLESLILPQSVKSIGVWAFYECTSLASVTFENTSGWSADGEPISATDLADPATAATYLRSTYCDYYWKCTEE